MPTIPPLGLPTSEFQGAKVTTSDPEVATEEEKQIRGDELRGGHLRLGAGHPLRAVVLSFSVATSDSEVATSRKSGAPEAE